MYEIAVKNRIDKAVEIVWYFISTVMIFDHKAVEYTYKHYPDPYAPEIWLDFSSCMNYSAFLKTPSGWFGLRRWYSQICLFLGGSVSKKVGGSILK